MEYLQANAVWITQSFVVIFATLTIDFVQRKVLRRLANRAERTPNIWDDALIESLKSPVSSLIWVLGLSLATEIISRHTDSSAFWFVDSLRNLCVIAILAWFLTRLIKQAENNIIQRRQEKGRPVDVTTLDAVAKLLRLSVIITATLVALQTMGFSVSGVLAFGGVGGIAIGFAAKDLLANFFGGLMIYLDRPFSVGDWIRSPDRDIEGTVEKIGWRQTVIRTFDKRPLYVPNSTFANIAVQNPSRMSNRRIYETIGVRYCDAKILEVILSDVKKMLVEHAAIDEKLTLMVNFNSFAPSSLDFFVYTFTHTTNWGEYHDIKQDVLLKIYTIIESHGAEVAFPTSTVHIPNQVNIQSESLIGANAHG